jgi:hypothetical protein
MRKTGVLLLVLMIGFSAFAQKRRGKQKPVSFQKHYNEVLPKAPQFKNSGWIIGPGATYMLAPFVSLNKTYQKTDVSKFDAKIAASGKPGIYLEAGRYKTLPYSRLFKYFDYGISYKSLRGKESGQGQYVSLPSETPLSIYKQTQGTFGYHYAEAFFNLNHIWRIGKYNFLQHSIGANAGYAFLTNQSGNTVSATTNANPGSFSTQLHYKLGYGIKMRGNWLLIPAIETPILNVMPFEAPRSSYAFFASRYRPLIFSLRFFFMRPANTLDCTPVRTREGLKMPTDMDKQNQMDGVK